MNGHFDSFLRFLLGSGLESRLAVHVSSDGIVYEGVREIIVVDACRGRSSVSFPDLGGEVAFSFVFGKTCHRFVVVSGESIAHGDGRDEKE